MPQAKLPLSFPIANDDQGMTLKQWPGVPSSKFPGSLVSNYSEGQIVGYRWYDKNGVAPAFPFGFGLSYGSPFSYSNLDIDTARRTITFDVKRAKSESDDDLAGCDTPQVYFTYPGADADPAVPAKVLRYFQKTCEASTAVTFHFTDRMLSTWDVATKEWVVSKGKFTVLVQAASQVDVATPGLKGAFTI